MFRVVTTGIEGYNPDNCPNGHFDPKTGKVDFGLGSNDNILSAEGGTIKAKVSGCIVGDAGCGGGWGNHLKVQHSADRYTLYAHFSSIQGGINVDSVVSQGQVLGLTDNTFSS